MANPKAIKRLLNLRRQRERRAGKSAIRCRVAADRAAGLKQEAQAALEAHGVRSAAQERDALAGLVGTSVTPWSLRRVRGTIEEATREAARLQENLCSAEAGEDACRDELAAARHLHRSHLAQRAKLERFVAALNGRSARRQAALAEAGEEENNGSAAAASAPGT